MKRSAWVVCAVWACVLLLSSVSVAAEKVSVNPVDGKPFRTVYPTMVMIVGTYCENGKADMSLIDLGGPLSSKPHRVGVGIRNTRATYANIMAKRAFTVNLPSKNFASEADYVGHHSMKKEPNLDKFAVTGLTPVRAETVDAPVVKEYPVTMECELERSLDLGSHTLFIGLVKKISINKDVLNPETGRIAPEKFNPLLYNRNARQYYSLSEPLGAPGEVADRKFK
ncbi:MAG: flavoredoxin [Dethiosulfovibrio peptidovorans]|nr:MAG: flavoredoxin [Dethiosulfovibrio peptidovorans]